MAQSMRCLMYHESFIEEWASGIWVCLYCASMSQMAQDSRDLLSRTKMREQGILIGRDHTYFNEAAPL